MPSPKAIEEFKELYFQRYGVRLPDAEAMEQAGKLLRLYKAVYGNLEMGTIDQHKKRYRINLIRNRRSYTVKEAGKLLGVHVRTVQSWIKEGLKTLDGAWPFLIMGCELKSFLKSGLEKQKIPLGPDEFFCMRCHRGVRASGMETRLLNKTLGLNKLAVIRTGNCTVCGCKVNRLSSIPKPQEGPTSFTATGE